MEGVCSSLLQQPDPKKFNFLRMAQYIRPKSLKFSRWLSETTKGGGGGLAPLTV